MEAMNASLGAFVLLTIVFQLTYSQQDGNPHHWDRTRRCDQIDYDPPCGVCEGIGGIPTGDKNEQYTPTTCTPVANKSTIDPKTLKRPVWGEQFTVNRYYEVLIGKKNDPFCFETFPGNDSIGALCYRPQEGGQTYDIKDKGVLRYDVEVKTIVGNLSSTVVHQGPYMWIINKLPWYAAGVHQCICTEPRQGGDWTTPNVYPIAYNWTDNLQYVGREKIGIEYIGGMPTLDHWAFGPHHIWSYPDSGQILRMWQPFNGLEVFPDGLGPGTIDPSKLADIPPAMCKKKGGAAFRIKCDDNGMPIPPSPPSTFDAKRARTKVPRAEYRGDSFSNMSATLNAWLEKDQRITATPCDQWKAEDMQQLQATLFLLRDVPLDSVYQASNDNRRLRTTYEDLQKTWDELNKLEKDPSTAAMQRDGHCHEAVMWYVHHLTDDTKEMVSQLGTKIPMLSHTQHRCPENSTPEQAQVCKMYEEQVTCASCHSNYKVPK